jgi:hypothetical protein
MAAPWLPDECVTTPRAAVASSSDQHRIAGAAELEGADALQVFGLEMRGSRRPSGRVERCECRTGVTCAWGAMRAAAARTSSKRGCVGSSCMRGC